MGEVSEEKIITIKSEPYRRFNQFHEPWSLIKFEDIYTKIPTNSLSREMLNYEEGEVKNIHYGDIHTLFPSHFEVGRENVPFIKSSVALKNLVDEKFCLEGDFILADASEDYNDIGKGMEIIDTDGEKIVSGLHTIHVRPTEGYLALGFAGQLFQTYEIRKQIMRIAQGTKVLGLSVNRLNKIKLLIPSLPEQQKITDFLSAIDKKLDLLQKKKKSLELYKKGVMQIIFSQELRFKDDQGKEFPEWEERQLKDITEIFDGTHQTPKYVGAGVPFYSVEHVTRNQFKKTKFISEEVFKKENQRVKLEKGDILLTRIGDIGTSKFIDWDVRASFYVSLALIKNRVGFNSQFVSHFFDSQFFQMELWKRTIHVAFPKKINLGELGKCRVKLPVIEEQFKIASFTTALDQKIEAVETQLEGIQKFKKGMVQQLFL